MRTIDRIREATYERHGFTLIDHKTDDAAVRKDIAEKVNALSRAADTAKKRLIMGTLRYGVPNPDNHYDYRARLQLKLGLYDDTGNQEFLVDAINYCVLELNWTDRTDVFFKAEDGDSSKSNRGYDK